MSLNGEDRKVAELQSEQGVIIRIGFYLTRLSACQRLVASEALVSIMTPWPDRPVDATAVLMNKYYYDSNAREDRSRFFAQENYQFHLKPTNNQMYAEAAKDPFPVRGYLSANTSYLCRPEIAVVVNSEWQVDPVNKTHNFQFSWDW